MQSPTCAGPSGTWYSVMPNMVNTAPKVTLPFSSRAASMNVGQIALPLRKFGQ